MMLDFCMKASTSKSCDLSCDQCFSSEIRHKWAVSNLSTKAVFKKTTSTMARATVTVR